MNMAYLSGSVKNLDTYLSKKDNASYILESKRWVTNWEKYIPYKNSMKVWKEILILESQSNSNSR